MLFNLKTRVRAWLAGGLLAISAGATFGQEVIPDFYKESGLSTNRDSSNQHFGEHIDPFTGALQLHYVDVHVPGNGGFDLDVVRSYSSAGVIETNPAAYIGTAGVGWTVHFGRVLNKSSVLPCNSSVFGTTVLNNPVIELPDGSRQVLNSTGNVSPVMMSTERWKADCEPGGLGLIVYSPDGVRYDMTQQVNVGTGTFNQYAWYTTKITDRNGNTATIAYPAASPQMSTVTASDGRVISFNYYPKDASELYQRINTITTSGTGGYTYTYYYQAIAGVAGAYNLTSVLRPDGTSWGYQYNNTLNTVPGSYVMKTLTYPEGGTLSYVYDYVYFDSVSNPMSRSTVVKTKTSSDSGSWSFTYAPGSTSTYDKTTVSGPEGTTTYQHVGPNYALSGSVWMVGLLMSKSLDAVQTESYAWTKQKISSQTNERPGAFTSRSDPGEVDAPILSSRTITRDGAPHVSNFSNFDTYGNAQTVTETGPDSGSRSTTLTYYTNPTLWILHQTQNQTVSGGIAITRSFDSLGNLSGITRDGVTTSITQRSTQGDVLTEVAPRSLTTTFSNYKRGIAQTENQPEGVNLARVVDDVGDVTSFTDGELHTTSYTYDGLNRVKSITYPTNNPVSIGYTATTKVATRGGLTETTTYDGFGRAKSIVLGGITRSYAYDSVGRMTFQSNPGDTIGTSFTSYDILGRHHTQSNADGSSRGISFGAGTMTVVNERSKSTTYTYKAFGDPDEKYLMAVASPEPGTNISIGRDGEYRVHTVTQGNFTRTYNYDTRGYLTSVLNPETGTTTYGRDDAGNMTSRSVGSSGTTTYGYDNQNRLWTETYPGTTPAVTKLYWRTNKLKSVTSSVATAGYTYDANDNLHIQSLTVGGQTYSSTLNYSSNDQVSTLTYPQTGSVVAYSPDTLGRPTTVSAFVSNVTYWPSGQINTITYGNNTTTTYPQNGRLWPGGFQTSHAGTSYANAIYGYDGVGNLQTITDSTDASYSRTLGYDNIDRLTTASGPWGTGSITYSGEGNIKTQVLGTYNLSYSYDTQNRLGSISGTRSSSYTYDAYGNISTAYGNTYAYDDLNLTCVNCASSTNKIAYTYDGMNQRLSVTKAGVTTYEFYGPHHDLLVEYTPTTGVTTEYFYLGGKRVAQRTLTNLTVTTTTLAVSPNPVAAGATFTMTATVTGSSPSGTVTFKDGTATLGTGTVTSGVATFSTSIGSAGSHSITASYPGDGNNKASTSAVVTLTVTAASTGTTTTTLVASPNPVAQGAALSLTATVAGHAPTGSVTFSDGATTLGTGTVNSTTGVATLGTTLSTVGSHSLKVVYGGDANNSASTSTAVSETVTGPLTATTTILAASPNPANVGQTVTLSASVAGTGVTGTVKFMDGTTVLGTGTVTSGVATLNTTFTSGGTHSLTAVYSGDSVNATSTASELGQGSVSLLLHMDGSNGAQTFVDSSVSAHVASTIAAGAVDDTANAKFGTSSGHFSGGYLWFDDSPDWAMGSGDFTTETWAKFDASAMGTRTLLFGQNDSIGGNATFWIGKSTGNVLTFSTLTDGTSASSVGTTPIAANVWYHLALVRHGSTMTLYLNGAVEASAPISGSIPAEHWKFGVGIAGEYTNSVPPDYGTLMLGWLDDFRITKGAALYTAPFTPPTAALPDPVMRVVAGTTSSTTVLSDSVNPTGLGQSTTLTATVTPSNATGAVTFKDGTATLGTGTLSAGKATLSISFSSLGMHSLTAVYAGDANDLASTSGALTHTVTAAATTTALTSSANPIIMGQSATLTARVTPSTASGTVTFKDGATTLGTGTLSSGVATLTATFSTAGTHSLTATYGGDTNDATSTSTALAEGVTGSSATTTVLNASPNPARVGQAVTLSASVAGSGVTGTVKFMDGTTVLGTGTVTSGLATLSTTFSSAGTHSLTAVYSGDSVNAASTASGLGQGSVSLLLHMDGSNSAQSFADSSVSAHVVSTIAPGVVDDTANAKFGTSSGHFSGGYLWFDDSPDWAMGSGDFTTETWAKFDTSAMGTRTLLFGQNDSTGGNATIQIGKSTGNVLTFYTSADGTSAASVGTTPIAANVWYHIALVRHGSTMTLYLNGAVEASAPISGSIPAEHWKFGVGIAGEYTNSVPPDYGTLMLGWLDDFRITKGAALYTAPFTPPTTALSDPVMRVIAAAATTTVVSAAPNPVAVNQSVTLSASVAGSGPTGSVTFKEGSTTLGTVALSGGSASLPVTFAVTGAHSITASYGGDADNAASTSSAVTVNVMPAGTTTTVLSANPNPVDTVYPVTLTATVSGVNPTGTVTFSDAGRTLGSAALSAGRASITQTLTYDGYHTLTASYAGDGSNAASSGALTLQTLAVKLALTSASNPVAVSVPVNLTATLSANSPTGTFTFLDGATPIGSPTAVLGGIVSIPATFATAGFHNVTVKYSGDANNPSATSAAVSVNVVTPVATTISWVTLPPTNATVGGSDYPMKLKIVPASGTLRCDPNKIPCDYGSVDWGTDGGIGGTIVPVVYDSGLGAYAVTGSYVAFATGSFPEPVKYLGTVYSAPSATTAIATVTSTQPTQTFLEGPPPNPSLLGGNYTLQVYVSAHAGLFCDGTSGTCNYGSVQLVDNGAVVATAPVPYAASLNVTWPATTRGTHTLVVKYLGTTSQGPSASTPLAIVVQ